MKQLKGHSKLHFCPLVKNEIFSKRLNSFGRFRSSVYTGLNALAENLISYTHTPTQGIRVSRGPLDVLKFTKNDHLGLGPCCLLHPP